MLYVSYTILLGRLRTCHVGSEKVNGGLSGLSSVLGVNLSPLGLFCSTVLFSVAWVSCQQDIFLRQTSS